MTAARAWEFQQAIYEAAEAGLREADGGAGVPVFDHPPETPPKLFVRLDGFDVVDLPTGGGAIAQHHGTVHVFDRQIRGEWRGQRRVKEIMGLLDPALRGLTIGSGPASSTLTLGSAAFTVDEDQMTQHAYVRVSAILSAPEPALAPPTSVDAALTDADGAFLIDDDGAILTVAA